MAKLKADAVPTLFQHLKLPQKRRSSEHRAEEFQKRAFVDDALAKPLSPPPMFSELAVQTISSLFSKETQTPHFKCVSKGIHNEIQRNYLFPVINKWYISTKKVILNELRVLPSVDLVGDGRCDSPGTMQNIALIHSWIHRPIKLSTSH